MKKKDDMKKLSLQKTTLRTLSNPELTGAVGGSMSTHSLGGGKSTSAIHEPPDYTRGCEPPSLTICAIIDWPLPPPPPDGVR